MLGIEDKSVVVAYFLCILSALACIIYGAINWNKGSEAVANEDINWAEEEKTVDEDF